MLGHHDVPARPAIGQAELVDQVVRPGAADDPRRVQLEARADGPAQLGRTAVGIAEQSRRPGVVGLLRPGGTPNAPSFDDSL